MTFVNANISYSWYYDIRGKNGKLTSGNFFWKWIIEMSIRNSCDKIAIEKQKNNNKTIKGRTFSFMSVK